MAKDKYNKTRSFFQAYFVPVKFYKWAKSQSGKFTLVSAKSPGNLEILTYAQKLVIYLPKIFYVIIYIRNEVKFLVFNDLSIFQKNTILYSTHHKNTY